MTQPNRFFRNMGAVAILVCLSMNTALGQPAAPDQLSVFPRYGASITMVVQWRDNSNDEEGFRIERRVEGSATWDFWQTLGAMAGTGQREWEDNTALAGTFYEYRVCATHSTQGNSAFTGASYPMTPQQVWPIHDGDHNILHSFGTPLDFNAGGHMQYLHEGVDLSASGKRVDAAQGGIIGAINANYNDNGGGLRIDVDWGPPVNIERISYQHTRHDLAWNVGDHIAAGDRIGTVNTSFFNRDPEADHCHWGTRNRNILIRYTANADLDPNNTPAVVADINNDGHDFIVVDAAANDHTQPRDPAWGEVDFLVDAYDDMAPGMDLMVNPHRLSYWIQSGVAGGENVQSAATPYCLVEFSFFIPGPEVNQFPQNALAYWALQSDIQGINTWQSCLTWILTNTRGTDGTQANISANEFWKTDARKGSGAEANGSDALVARENQDARFPDGTYFVHVIADDLVHSTDYVRSVLVDNSRPYVKKVTVYSGLGVVSLAEWSWDAATQQLSIQPAVFEDASTFPAGRTQDMTIEVEFSEPMQSASITTITPQGGAAALGVTPTLSSDQPEHNRTIWRGMISNLDIADDGSHDGYHKITITGTDLAGNTLLQINNRNSMGADHHNRDNAGNMRGIAGSDNIHGFRIGHLEGEITVTAIFMKQTAADPATPAIPDKTLAVRDALNAYFDEVSYGDISFALTGVGWYQLDHPLNWYYSDPQNPLIDLAQEAVTKALTGGVDLSATQYILVVTDETAARVEWSTNGPWPYHIPADPGRQLLASGVINLSSSDARITNVFGRMVGLIDLFAYPYVSFGRDFVGPWSHMSDKEHQVHVLGWEKWRAGWIDETGTATAKTITHVDKPAFASPITGQTYTILPLNTNTDGVKAVAIEVGDRLHYTAEYRRQADLDSDLPDEGVLIVKANEYINQGEGPAIVQNATLATPDLSDATYTTAGARNIFDDPGSGVKIEVTSMNANQAEIKLDYQVPATENDVYVSPHDSRWKAEDIWIDAPDLEGNFAANPVSIINANEKPVVGEVNHLHGRVRNKGHADATNFEVHLEILEPWGSGATWHSLKIDNVTLLQGQDHASDAYYLITCDWTPTAGEHTCVRLKVRGVANDVNPENNDTQENISEFVTTPGSPYQPVTTRFQVENPYNVTRSVFFRIDGLPENWSYILTPERLLLPPAGRQTVQVTLQPNNEAPLCSEELVTLTAYTPWVDALTRLGAISLQVELKNPAIGIYSDSWFDCKQGKYLKERSGPAALTTAHQQMDPSPGSCAIFTQGCTDPGTPNTEVAIVYTAPDGSKQVHYVMTDENGCFSDILPVTESGEWEVESVIEEEDCRAGSESDPGKVDVDLGDIGRRKFTCYSKFGPALPVGDFDDVYDPGFSFSIGLEKQLTPNLLADLQIGHHQFYSTVRNQHFGQIGLNLKYIYPGMNTHLFVQAGSGLYIPRYGTNTWGVNVGFGMAWHLLPKMYLDLGVHYHLVNHSADAYERAMFITIPVGIKWRF